MVVLSVKRVCDEFGVKLPHEVKQILLAKQNITEIEDLGLIIFSTYTRLRQSLKHGGSC